MTIWPSRSHFNPDQLVAGTPINYASDQADGLLEVWPTWDGAGNSMEGVVGGYHAVWASASDQANTLNWIKDGSNAALNVTTVAGHGGAISGLNIGPSGQVFPIMPTAGSDWTIAVWIKTTGTDNVIFGGRQTGAGQDLIDFVIGANGISNNGTGKISIIPRDASGNAGTTTDTTVAVNDGNWHFVAAVKKGTTIYLYRDPTFGGVAVASGPWNNSSGVTLNACKWAGEYQNGALTALNITLFMPRVYTVAKTNDQLAAMADPGTRLDLFKPLRVTRGDALLSQTLFIFPTYPKPLRSNGPVILRLPRVPSIFAANIINQSITDTLALTENLSEIQTSFFYVFPTYARIPFSQVGPTLFRLPRVPLIYASQQIVVQNITDTITVSEIVSIAGSIYNKSFVDNIVVTENLTEIQNSFNFIPPTYPRQTFRLVGPTPLRFTRPQFYTTQANLILKTVVDTLTLTDTDSYNAIFSRTLSDTTSPSEALVESDARTQAISDNLSLSDALSVQHIIVRTLIDTLVISDIAVGNLGQRVFDTITITDHVYYGKRSFNSSFVGSVQEVKSIGGPGVSPPDVKVVSPSSWSPTEVKTVSGNTWSPPEANQ